MHMKKSVKISKILSFFDDGSDRQGVSSYPEEGIRFFVTADFLKLISKLKSLRKQAT